MGRLEVRVIEARSLPKGHIGKPKPLVDVSVGVHRACTRAGHGRTPRWDELFQFPVENPLRDELKIEVAYHHALRNHIIGRYTFPLSSLTRGQPKDAWCILRDCKSKGELRVVVTALDFGKEPVHVVKAEPWMPYLPSHTNITTSVNTRVDSVVDKTIHVNKSTIEEGIQRNPVLQGTIIPPLSKMTSPCNEKGEGVVIKEQKSMIILGAPQPEIHEEQKEASSVILLPAPVIPSPAITVTAPPKETTQSIPSVTTKPTVASKEAEKTIDAPSASQWVPLQQEKPQSTGSSLSRNAAAIATTDPIEMSGTTFSTVEKHHGNKSKITTTTIKRETFEPAKSTDGNMTTLSTKECAPPAKLVTVSEKMHVTTTTIIREPQTASADQPQGAPTIEPQAATKQLQSAPAEAQPNHADKMVTFLDEEPAKQISKAATAQRKSVQQLAVSSVVTAAKDKEAADVANTSNGTGEKKTVLPSILKTDPNAIKAPWVPAAQRNSTVAVPKQAALPRTADQIEAAGDHAHDCYVEAKVPAVRVVSLPAIEVL